MCWHPRSVPKLISKVGHEGPTLHRWIQTLIDSSAITNPNFSADTATTTLEGSRDRNHLHSLICQDLTGGQHTVGRIDVFLQLLLSVWIEKKWLRKVIFHVDESLFAQHLYLFIFYFTQVLFFFFCFLLLLSPEQKALLVLQIIRFRIWCFLPAPSLANMMYLHCLLFKCFLSLKILK